MKNNDNAVLAKQMSEWTREMNRLAGQIAAAKGQPCAVVMITALSEDYADVAAELIVEDALRVQSYGWPEGFDVAILNPTA